MDKAMGRLVLLVGTVLYAVIGVLAVLTYIWQVEFFSLAALGIALQVAVAIPMVGFLLGRTKLPVLPYAKWMLGMAVALSVSGFLGVPQGSYASNPSLEALRIKADAIEADDLGGRDALKLNVELAGAEDDDEKKAIKKELSEIADGISKEDRSDAKRRIAVLKAESRLKQIDADARRSSLLGAERRSGLMLLAAFLMFGGAWLMDRNAAA